MPRFSPRQIITTFSTIYLLTLTTLAAYALHRTTALSLPIPNALSALTLALPALAGIALETLITSAKSSSSSSSSSNPQISQTLTALFFVILESVLAALSGTHLAPMGGLWCPLHDRWQGLYRAKQAAKIRAIQDALGCCGFQSVRDMAWPFVSDGSQKEGGGEVCSVRYGRDEACFEGWRNEERKVAGLLLVVPVGVFLWKVVLFLLLPTFSSESNSDWLPSTIRLPNENNNNSHNRSRQAITYHRDVEEQQQQQQQGDDADEEEEGESNSLRQEVNQLNQDSNLASRVEGGRRAGRGLVEQGENGWLG